MIDVKSTVEKLMSLKPEKIILFGSYVKGTPNPNSDLDLLIIKKTKKKPTQRIQEALRLVWGSIPHIEPQIITPEELQEAIDKNRFFITQEVLKYGKVIYEKK